MTKTALFHNFTDKPFTGYWNGKSKTFKPGEKRFMPLYLAEHYAKHLTNSVLLSQGKENSTSPKNPEQVPDFMEIFNKACIVQEGDDDQDDAELETDLANRSRALPEQKTGPGKEAQIIAPPAGDDEENFEGLDDKKE